MEANAGQLWGALSPAPREELEGTVLVEATADVADLARRLESTLYSPEAERREAVVFCLDEHRAPVEALLAARFRPIRLVSLAPGRASENAARVLRHVRTARVQFLAAGATFDPMRWDDSHADSPSEVELPATLLRRGSAEALSASGCAVSL